MLPSKLWLILGLTAAALLAIVLHPLVAALIGIVVSLLFLWLILGGGS